MAAPHALTLTATTPDSPTITVDMPFETADALVNLLQRNSADLTGPLATLLPALRTITGQALDVMVEHAFGPGSTPAFDLLAA